MNTWVGRSSRMETGRRGRILATMVVLAAALVALGSTAALAAGRQKGRQGSTFRSGTIRVDFADRLGRSAETPVVGVRTVVPGMAPIVRFVTLANTGTLPAEAVLSTTGLGGSERSLDDVLALTVRGEDGEHLYRGKLSGLALVGGRLEPGQCRTYQLAISWPSTAHDNDYQGLPLSFGLQAHATPAAE
jgi:hypothetical protein